MRPKNQIIPFKAVDEVGIIPKHECSYLEVAMLTGNMNISKNAAKEVSECIIKNLSEKVRAGKQVKTLIPYVG